MSDDIEPIVPDGGTVKPLSHSRILKLMAVVGLAGGILGAILVSAKFGAGVVVGGLLAFANYYWLKNSLRKVFDLASETGERPRFLGLKFFGRYLALGVAVAVLYATDVVSVAGLILGLGSFGFAIVLEGVLKIFFSPAATGENR